MIEREQSSGPTTEKIICVSSAFKQALHKAERVAKRNIPVLISGPTGSGKEVLAQFIHSQSRNPEAPFIDINCGAIPENLFESALFGHVRGAFTGATTDHPGYMESAGTGTLFLDEIAEMPLSLQPKLLRALETRTFRPVGSSSVRQFKGRILAATHRNLPTLVQDGRFREDLFYRLCVFLIEVPGLSQRREDIPHLVEHFSSLSERGLTFTEEALAFLQNYPWHGNIRELKNMVDRLSIVSDFSLVDISTVQSCLSSSGANHLSSCENLIDMILSRPTDENKLELVEQMLVSRTLENTGGNKAAAARILGVNRKIIERRHSKSQKIHRMVTRCVRDANLLMEQGDFKSALAVLKAAHPEKQAFESHVQDRSLLCEFYSLLGRCHPRTAGWLHPDAVTYNEKAVSLARGLENHKILNTTLFMIWTSQIMSLNIKKARETASELLFQARNQEDKSAENEACIALANTYFWQGDCLETKSCIADSGLLTAETTFSSTPHYLDLQALAIMFEGLSDFQLGAFSEARQSYDRLIKRDNTPGVPIQNRIFSLQGIAWLGCLFEDYDRMGKAAHDLTDASNELGLSFFTGIGRFFIGCHLMMQNQFPEAEKEMIGGYEQLVASNSGGKLFHSFQAWKLGQLLLKTDRAEESVNLVSKAIDFAVKHQEKLYLVELMELHARAQLAMGNMTGGLNELRSAIGTSRILGMIPARIAAGAQLRRIDTTERDGAQHYLSLGLPEEVWTSEALPPTIKEEVDILRMP